MYICNQPSSVENDCEIALLPVLVDKLALPRFLNRLSNLPHPFIPLVHRRTFVTTGSCV